MYTSSHRICLSDGSHDIFRIYRLHFSCILLTVTRVAPRVRIVIVVNEHMHMTEGETYE